MPDARVSAAGRGWPALCPWLPANLRPRVMALCWRAHTDIGVCEVPERGQWTNRSPYIDEMLREAQVPESIIVSGKGYWCAAWVGRVYRDCGMRVPQGWASCDNWMTWAKAKGLWRTTPGYGYAVVYGVPGDAQHIGIVTRPDPVLCSVEGNRGLSGAYTTNGIAVDFGPVVTARVLGYIEPSELAA